MHVILFHIGSFPVRAYGTIIAIAILLSLGVAHFLAKGTKYRQHLMDIIVYVIVGAVVGARLWEVLFFEGGYYIHHPLESFAIWKGGLSIQGGLVGGFVTGLIYCRRYRLSFWEFADIAAPAVVFGQGVGRIACLLNGDAFGTPTNAGYGLVYPPGTIAYDTYGSQPLWPAEVWEGQLDLVIFGLLLILKNRKWTRGYIFLFYSIFYSFGRFMLEMLRGDTPRYLFNWTAAQWTSVVVIVLALLFVLWNRRYGSADDADSCLSASEAGTAAGGTAELSVVSGEQTGDLAEAAEPEKMPHGDLAEAAESAETADGKKSESE